MWYITRGTGFVALVLLTMSVVLGITEVTRWARPTLPRFVIAALHKNVSLLVLVFLAIHVVTAVADSFAPIGWLDVVIPFHSPYRPLWLGLGTVSVDLLLALTITSLLRNRLGYRTWRAVHWTSYASWPLALLHGLGTGTDTSVRWALLLSLASLLAVVVAVIWRLVTARGTPVENRVLIGLATAMLVVALLGWTSSYPTQPGWARSAGTPTALLGTSRVGVRAPSTTLHAPFTARLAGKIHQSPTVNGRATVTIDALLAGPTRGRVHLALVGSVLAAGGVHLGRGYATLGTRTQPALYRGSVVALNGTDLTATVRDSTGHSMTLSIHLAINPLRTNVTGSLSARVATG